MNEDALLIDEALAGKSASFGLLVRRYQDRLFTTMSHVTGNVEEAQDVVQEAFVQAFVKLDTFQGAAGFYTWLYRIAFNLAISRRRRAKPVLSVEHSRELTGEEPIDGRDAPHERIEQQERVSLVRAGLAALSEEHRAILVLREIDGFSYETIAEMLVLPVGTVRSRIHRARLQLRDALAELLKDELEDGKIKKG